MATNPELTNGKGRKLLYLLSSGVVLTIITFLVFIGEKKTELGLSYAAAAELPVIKETANKALQLAANNKKELDYRRPTVETITVIENEVKENSKDIDEVKQSIKRIESTNWQILQEVKKSRNSHSQ